VTDTTPVSREILTAGVALAVVDVFSKFKRAWLHPQNDHVTHTTPLSGENFYPVVGLAVVDPLAKFKECSFIHSRNIDVGF